MNIQYSKKEEYTVLDIQLSADEVAHAIYSYLFAHGYYIEGASTVSINGKLCTGAKVNIDSSVIFDGERYNKKKCDSCLDTGKVAEDCEHCYGGNSTFEDDEATECDWCDGDGYTNAPCDHCEKGRQLEKAELSRNRL